MHRKEAGKYGVGGNYCGIGRGGSGGYPNSFSIKSSGGVGSGESPLVTEMLLEMVMMLEVTMHVIRSSSGGCGTVRAQQWCSKGTVIVMVAADNAF